MPDDPLKPGDPAPNFRLSDQFCNQVTLDSMRGQRFVLFFFPKAGTAGCTREVRDFQEHHDRLRFDGFHVIGVSPDSPTELCDFAEREGLSLRLLSDSDEECHKKYRAFGDKQRDGKTVRGILRATFVIDTYGTITWAQYRVNPWTHVTELVRDGSWR